MTWRSLRRLAVHEGGAEQMEYLIILSAVVLPLVYAAHLMWAVLLYYFRLGAFVIDFAMF